MNKISVLVVDDSAIVRKALSEIIEKTPDLELTGTASDPVFAMRNMGKKWPDVIVLDIEMPRMDGITFLKKIMSERPTPVIICSSLEMEGAQASLNAMSNGAVAVITKPKIGLKSFFSEEEKRFIQEIRAAAQANMQTLRNLVSTRTKKESFTDSQITGFNQTRSASSMGHNQLVAIGASTGGTQALEHLLSSLKANFPPIVIVQHMPEKFTAAFAKRLNDMFAFEVKEAEDLDAVSPGRVLIAPGGKHMEVEKRGNTLRVRVKDGPLVNRHKPSVDILFRSVAKIADNNTLGIIMTGMGDDGAAGLLEMRNAGAKTIAQDEASCVVFGMPQVAIKLGAADKVIPLNQIARHITE